MTAGASVGARGHLQLPWHVMDHVFQNRAPARMLQRAPGLALAPESRYLDRP